MATKITNTCTCDMTKGETGQEVMDAETVEFGLEGVTYEIDLSPDWARKLRELLRPYTDVAHRTGSTKRGPGHVPSTSAKVRDRRELLEAVRQWARRFPEEFGDISRFGRVPERIIDSYHNRDKRTPVAGTTATGTTATDAPAAADERVPAFSG